MSISNFVDTAKHRALLHMHLYTLHSPRILCVPARKKIYKGAKIFFTFSHLLPTQFTLSFSHFFCSSKLSFLTQCLYFVRNSDWLSKTCASI